MKRKKYFKRKPGHNYFKNIFFFLFQLLLICNVLQAENGYKLWLSYNKIENDSVYNLYRNNIQGALVYGDSKTIDIARNELLSALNGLISKKVPIINNEIRNGIIIAGTPKSSDVIKKLNLDELLKEVQNEGFIIKNHDINGNKVIVIAANTDIGVLYGTFHFLKLLQIHQLKFDNTNIVSAPKIIYRLLNHWDNLDRTVERGYAGFSIWDWHRLPDYIDQRYYDYARANASIGINGTVLTNVNANAHILTESYIKKVAALADIFRPYGIRVYLTARFSAPIELDRLKTGDPLNDQVKEWWKKKVDEIYRYIPDFGGFLVKANSEGQPGPQNYKRTHADGANMLSEAVGNRGIVMWRAFVYDDKVPVDRSKQAYNEFKPLDGKFNQNVFIQVKNGPIDFQPREPFHPLFGAMPKTSLMMEFQITQEYLGQGTHLVYLAPMYKECLYSDTYANGEGSFVAKIIDDSLYNNKNTGIAGVSNIGTDINWTGHLFGQANWYAFGRLAWNHSLSSESIADEWLKMTFTCNNDFIAPVKKMMLASHEIAVNYMTPIGLHHQMGLGHHYGPGPWVEISRPDWSSTYYHRADKEGIGFDRTDKGSNAVEQYFNPVKDIFNNLKSCPIKYLLWFHHLPWDYQVNDERNLWEELCYRFYTGAQSVVWMQETWGNIEGLIDIERYEHVKMLLEIQAKEAIWWRNSMVLYFQTFSKMPIPDDYEKPDKTLEYYMNLKFPYAPGK